MTDLSTDQRDAFDAICQRCETIIEDGCEDNTAVLAGAAGTGKTTITRHLLDYFDDLGLSYCLMAPTWKAARRLEFLTDRIATSIHKMIYLPPSEEEGRLDWKLAPQGLYDFDVVLCDEGSMVGKPVARDLLSVTRKKTVVFVVADFAQLPPVDEGGEGQRDPSPWGFRVMQPDAKLTKVHRVAEGNPLLQLATATREGRNVPSRFVGKLEDESGFCFEKARYGDGYLDRLVEVTASWYSLSCGEGSLPHIVITGRNETRNKVNARFRQHFGFEGEPQEGEPLLVLSNQGDGGCYNGDIVTVSNASKRKTKAGHWYLAIETTDGGYLEAPCNEDGTPFALPGPALRRAARANSSLVNVSFGYAATCHKMQGSQARRVTTLLFDGDWVKYKCGDDDYRRWVYTAYTRAEEKLFIMWS